MEFFAIFCQASLSLLPLGKLSTFYMNIEEYPVVISSSSIANFRNFYSSKRLFMHFPIMENQVSLEISFSE